MKSLDILRLILVEAETQLSASTSRDWMTIQSRHEHEGESFLGITLPAFAKWFERSMEQGKVETSIFSSFREVAGGKSVLPCFLHGLTSRVFDAKTGLIRSDLDESAVFFIRQICLFRKKVFEVCSPEREAASVAQYVEIEDSLRSVRLPNRNSEERRWVATVCEHIVPSIENHFIETLHHRVHVPKHGPGVTADRRSPNGKFMVRDFYRRWRGVFSWEELYGLHTAKSAEGREILEAEELPVKVLAVPKTMEKARIIAAEPTAMQYAQQLTSSRLIDALRASGVYRQLNFQDQTVNQRLAKKGSVDGSFATLDLSDASNRLHSKLVRCLLRLAPTLSRHVFACRTGKAELPDGTVRPLRMYASQGSALTFPIEALCFYIISCAAVCSHFFEQWSNGRLGEGLHDVYPVEDGRYVYEAEGSPYSSYALTKRVMRSVFVFGDDIIVPSAAASRVISYLETFSLKVNTGKSFYKGPFRESCGHDYVNGVFVTPVYMRRHAPESIRDAESLISWVSMCNRLHDAGLWLTADAVREYLDSIVKLPMVAPTCQGIGYTHPSGAYQPDLFEDSNWWVNTLVASSKKVSDPMDGESALLASLLKLDRSSQQGLRGGSSKYLEPVLHRFDNWRDLGAIDDLRSSKRHSLRLRRKKVRPY